VIDSAKISKLACRHHSVAEFRDLVGAGVTATLSGADPATELKKAHEHSAHPGAQREVVSCVSATESAPAQPAPPRAKCPVQPPSYWPFVLPALIVVLAVIIFPWPIRFWIEPARMEGRRAADLRRPRELHSLCQAMRASSSRCGTHLSIPLSVALPLLLGTLAAWCFHAKFPMRGFLRGLFILPMMATRSPSRWLDHDVHPQLVILKLPAVAGGLASLWVFHPRDGYSFACAGGDVQWTPLGDADRARRPRPIPASLMRAR